MPSEHKQQKTSSASESPLTPEFLREQQTSLETSLNECQNKVRQLRTELSKGNIGKEVRGDSVDRAFAEKERLTNAQEIDYLQNLIKQHRKALSLIQGALKGERRNNEEYGKCLECGKRIPLNRLRAIPWASLCVCCQQKQERIT